MAMVGFTGSRKLSSCWQPQVAALVQRAQSSGHVVGVGCAKGADALVRGQASQPLVFSVSGGAFGAGRGAFVRRSQALVTAVVGSGAGAWLAAFVSSPCPAGIAVANTWRSGVVPSGSWSTLALAVGHGVPVFVVWCGSGKPQLPSWAGCWHPVTVAGVCGWRFQSHAPRLF